VVLFALKGIEVALALGLVIGAVLGAATSVVGEARGWRVAAVVGIVCVAAAVLIDATTELGFDVVAPGLVAFGATKVILDRMSVSKPRG
jgi:lipoprotein signal peptidase